jgi:hypothetical protein
VPDHALLAHPRERVGRWPVAAQADLHEAVSGHRARLDQPPHWRAVAGEVAVDDVGGVGVGVEVDDADVAVAVHVGDSRRRRPGDRVVAAEHDRHDAARRDLMHPLPDVGVARLRLAVRAVGVAVVDGFEVLEDLDPEVEVVRARLVREGADRTRAESGAGPVGGGDVERRTYDRHVWSPRVELFGVGEERPLPERGETAEHVPELELFVHPRRQRAISFGHAPTVRPRSRLIGAEVEVVGCQIPPTRVA